MKKNEFSQKKSKRGKMNFFVRSMPSSSRQARSESSAQDDGFGGPFSPSPSPPLPPQKCTSVRTRRLQAWAGLLRQSGLVRAQSAHPFSFFSPRTLSLSCFSRIPVPPCLRALSVSLPWRRLGDRRRRPLPGAQVISDRFPRALRRR